jgi:undecaprenyl diphosphate synthase
MLERRVLILRLSRLLSKFPRIQTKLFINSLDKNNIPNHVAIIMDGNGRWAKKRGFPRLRGHEEGTKSVKRTLEIAYELNINYLTLFAFSQENWSRPKQEVDGLLKLIENYFENELKQLNEKGIKVIIIGNFKRVPKDILNKIDYAHEVTKDNKKMNLCIAFSYGGRDEITQASKCLVRDILEGKIDISDINENIFENYLYTKNIPNPDLLIRTSGEIRISNFLLWQIAYTEFVFMPVLWPDFNKNHFLSAILEYQTRERRFGLV